MPQWPCAVGLTDQSLGLPSGRSESDILVLLQSYNLSPQMLLALTPKPLFLQEVPKKGFDAAEETKWCLVSCSYKTCEEGYVEMYRVNMPGQLGPTSVVEAGSLLREFINLGANRLKVRHAQASNHNPPGSVSRGASTSAFFPYHQLVSMSFLKMPHWSTRCWPFILQRWVRVGNLFSRTWIFSGTGGEYRLGHCCLSVMPTAIYSRKIE